MDKSKAFALNFVSREDFLKVANAFFLRKGYALSIKSSRKNKYVTVGCSRGGEYRDRLNIPIEKRKRNTSTRLINCPFEIKGKKEYDNSWKVEIKNDVHNHCASKDMSGYPSARILSKDHVLTIDEMTKAGAPPRQIISVLRRRDPKLLAVSRDVYNTKAKILKASLGGRSNITVLFEELGKNDFIFDVLRDEEDHLTHVFFAHSCCNISFYKEVVTRVSLFAMKQIHKQYQIACHEENSGIQSECSGKFAATMGLPCAHVMKNLQNKVLPLESVHSQWRIDSRSSIFDDLTENDFGELVTKLTDNYKQWPVGEKKDAHTKLSQIVNGLPMLFEPRIQRSKGRQKNTKNKSSTKRNPSQFKIVESGRSTQFRS